VFQRVWLGALTCYASGSMRLRARLTSPRSATRPCRRPPPRCTPAEGFGTFAGLTLFRSGVEVIRVEVLLIRSTNHGGASTRRILSPPAVCRIATLMPAYHAMRTHCLSVGWRPIATDSAERQQKAVAPISGTGAGRPTIRAMFLHSADQHVDHCVPRGSAHLALLRFRDAAAALQWLPSRSVGEPELDVRARQIRT
jgi:hypothetical protein